MIKKVLKALTISLIITGCLTGCDGGIESYLDHAVDEFNDRGDLNKQEVDRLYKAGIITADTQEGLKKSIDATLGIVGVDKLAAQQDTVDKDGNVTKSADTKTKELLDNANIKGCVRICWGDIKAYLGSTGDNGKGGLARTHKISNGSGGNIQPFNLITGSKQLNTEDGSTKGLLEELNSRLQYQVYVLRKSPDAKDGIDDFNAYTSINEISNTCELASKEADSGGQIDKYLGNLFIYSGRTILNIADESNLVIKPTETLRESGNISSGSLSYDEAKLWKKYQNADNKSMCPNNNEMGEDLVLVHNKPHKHTDENGNEYYTYSINRMVGFQLEEFNRDAIDLIVGKDNINSRTYIISGNKAYLMDYPIYYISGWETIKKEDNSYMFIPQYKLSNLIVNLIDNKIYYNDGSGERKELYQLNNEFRVKGVNVNGESSLILDGVSRFKGDKDTTVKLTNITYGSNKYQTIVNKPSYTGDSGYYDNYICDYGYITFSEEALNSNQQSIKTMAQNGKEAYEKNMTNFGSIVLRDYLEYTYAPNVISGENAVALGRIFRIKTFSGNSQDEVIGTFIGKRGDENNTYNSVPIKVRDLMDVGKLANNLKYKLDFGNSEDDSTEDTDTYAEPDDPMNLKGLTADDLKVNYNKYIMSTARFPGTIVNVSDNSNIKVETESNKIKPIMYGMALDLDAYTSNLISNWVTLTDDGGDLGSLQWWNEWLITSGYTYQIDRDILINSLQGNYNFDITNSNRIILNINTLQTIQKLYDERQESNSVGFIKSVFKVLGLMLIFYSVLILTAWIYDTNIVVGPRLMGMLTLGRWKAIADSSELPEVNMDGKAYMPLGKVITSVIFLISIGIILNVIGITELVLLFIKLFAGLWEMVKSAIIG